MRGLACVAEGLGLRATARGFAVDPQTVRHGLGEAAAPRRAFSCSLVCAVHGPPGPRDALSAVRRAVKDGERREAEARPRRARSPQGVWTVLAPVTQRRRASDGGPRPRALAPGVGPQVARRLAPDGRPLVLTEGETDDFPALLTPLGPWGQPRRRQATGPAPKPRWRPLPGLLEAQGIQTVRRRRLGRVRHRVVCGTLAAMEQGRAAPGGPRNPACLARLTRTIRPQGAAVGRRGATLGQGEDGVRQPRGLSHGSDHGCLPHASFCQPLPLPEPTNGTGSARPGRPCTPAMAVGRTEHVWTLREGLLFRVPPWPPPQSVSATEPGHDRGTERRRGARDHAKRVA